MLFNSIDFAIFLPVFFILYWFTTNKNLKLQNTLIVIASYIFYGWWDWRFLSLIFFSTIVDYLVGIQLSTQENQLKRKVYLGTSIVINIGFLGFFKYYNFFLDTFVTSFSFFGIELNSNSLNIILPVGISFYTFQTLSYTIDVYKRKLEPTKDFVSFSAFVSFFPQLVAGPIERASNLLPQLLKKRSFDYDNAVCGLTQIVWGLFKKVVIADSCALIVNSIFDDYMSYSGSTLLLGAFLFAFQIYGDFSGYSDIAIGTSRLFGFKLMRNFAFPYFSRDIAEFWRRWHISLSTWFRDYLYIPLGGSRGSIILKLRNTFIIFLVSGFWHGANWTFIVWGALNAVFFIPLLLTKNNRNHIDIVAKDRLFPSLKEVFLMLSTFTLTVFAWIFFRSESLSMAFGYFDTMLSPTLFSIPYVFNVGMKKAIIAILSIALLIGIEWFGRRNETPIYLSQKPNWIKWFILFVFGLAIFLFGERQQDFIYFQF
ncbi:MBOAT family O-acyltransferase [Carboxylicivirga marina]|uniref:MBOAT family protein n=1 Tax=Carboxylicivirga marina TaxID=2800988 RepID=A0ABS1HQK3_9BACT|nr:MBOAT family protein [Carboxylicivirga marina]MBK3519439.1 MBOAT family protein [Carboxylicivirga marina]